MAQILDAFGPVKRRLGGGKPDPLQNWTHRCSEVQPDPFGQQAGLIKTAFALPRRVQWHWNDRVESEAADSRVIKRGDEPGAD